MQATGSAGFLGNVSWSAGWALFWATIGPLSGAGANHLFTRSREKKKTKEEERLRQKEAQEAKVQMEQKVKAVDVAPGAKWEGSLFARRLTNSADIAKRVSAGADIVVVASGKGGVGKSTLSLALLEAYSRTADTLLVDFDMHNRGLSSLLKSQVAFENCTSVLDEMERFRKIYIQSDLEQLATKGEVGPAEFAKFAEFRDHFAKDQHGGFLPLRVHRFAGDPLPVTTVGQQEHLAIIPENAAFLPSLKPGALFLESEVFEASFTQVFYFLKCLAYFAASPENHFRTIILDCHGAHDLFMVGAIHSATEMVIVTTPDPGSFDGTFDLLAFAANLQTAVMGSPFPAVLVINNCEDWENESRQVLEKFYRETPARPHDIIGIGSRADIRAIAHHYEIGAASKSEELWNRTVTVQKKLKEGRKALAAAGKEPAPSVDKGGELNPSPGEGRG